MQIFAKLPSAKTIVVDVDPAEQVYGVAEQASLCSLGVALHHLRIVFGGKQLDSQHSLEQCGIKQGVTVHVLLRLLGGAAESIRLEPEMHEYPRKVGHEYESWHDLADKTEQAGIMRLLCVSLTLEKSRENMHKDDPRALDDDADCRCYDDWSEQARKGKDSDEANILYGYDKKGKNSRWGTGFVAQKDYNEAFKKIWNSFLEIWQYMIPMEPGLTIQYKYKNKKTREEFDVYLEFGNQDQYHALWHQGPTNIIKMGSGECLWSFKEWAEKKVEPKLWLDDGRGVVPPWRIAGEFADIERWFYEGIGITTYLQPKPMYERKDMQKPILWSQADNSDWIALTDREKLRLKQAAQLYYKKVNLKQGEKLEENEEALWEEVMKLVEYVEYGFEDEAGAKKRDQPKKNQSGMFVQFRIKPLKRFFASECVFWTNTEPSLPAGSVADKTKTKKGSTGTGIEQIEFWKYKKKIGTIRKKYVIEDRQRLLDTIERFTRPYTAVIKDKGEEGDGDNSDHFMNNEKLKKIISIVALAMDMHMPDYPEDRIACFVKTEIEERLGPTWHVIVGRCFGFSLQCEARHFVHMFMLHLAFVIWKSEPDRRLENEKNG